MAQTQYSMDTPDSDNEDDPAKLLNHWLGELNHLKEGLDIEVKQAGEPSVPLKKPVNHRNYGAQESKLSKDQKQKYRCSLINIEKSQDDELDAILGELTVLESKFDQEINEHDNSVCDDRSVGDSAVYSPATDQCSSHDLGAQNETQFRSNSSPSKNNKKEPSLIKCVTTGPQSITRERTDSPDTDSAFCDNLSVLSSCSTTSSNKIGQTNGVGSINETIPITKEEQEAKIKAEKIKIAIEKIKEASVKKLFIKVFTSDGSAKSLLVDEKMTVGQVTRILAEKNHKTLDQKWALVELVPDLYMERVYEDHELLVENCLLWKVDSKNTVWFIERPEKFDLFLRPEIYLLDGTSSQKSEAMEDHCRQELIEEYFSSSGASAPQLEGNIWLKTDNKKSWKKYYFILRTSGLYYTPKGKKNSKDLVCLTTFDVNQVYYGVGWHDKYKAPTQFCFGIKHPQIQAKNPKYIKYLCVDTQKELHQWVTCIRTAKNGSQLYENYRCIVEDITHADIDVMISKRFSINSSSGPKIGTFPVLSEPKTSQMTTDEKQTGTQLLTPTSENKSLSSALSSGIESDMSTESNTCASTQSYDNHLLSKKQNGNSGAIVNQKETLDRGSKLRSSYSRSSRSSSSSGSLSEKQGAAGLGERSELGFESDFPLGGTIKKRPAILPVTSTTWGLVKVTDQDIYESIHDTSGSFDSSDNIGSTGGTLLRKTVKKNQQRKPKLESEPNQMKSSDPVEKPPSDPLSSAFERSISCMSEMDDLIPLPPPPRVDSVTSLDSIDMLPPPPPDISSSIVNTKYNLHDPPSSHYHVSPVTSPVSSTNHQFHTQSKTIGLPPPVPGSGKSLTSTLKKSGTIQKGNRRISFDDNVKTIDVPPHFSSNEPHQEKTHQPIAKFCPAPPIRNPSPNKITFVEEEPTEPNYGSLPRSFLENLQKVINKKWQVAEKCKIATPGEKNTPHEVLGFRDEHLNSKATGQPNLYSKNSAIGAWVLETQLYAHKPLNLDQDQYDQGQRQHNGYNHYESQQDLQPQYQVYNAQQQGQCVYVPELESEYGQYKMTNHNDLHNLSSANSSHSSHSYYSQHMGPVVLKDPEMMYVDPSQIRDLKSTSGGTKLPPPPPQRSTNTKLTNSGY